MLEKNVQTPSNIGNRLILTGMILFVLLSLAGTAVEAYLLDRALPAPRVDVTVTVTPASAPALLPANPMHPGAMIEDPAPTCPISYEECMDLAIHHEELRPMRCCRPDETCMVFDKKTIELDH